MDPLLPGETAGKPLGRRLFLALFFGGIGLAAVGSRFAGGLTGAASRIAGDGFRIYTVAPIPDWDPDTFRLTVDGEVSTRLDLPMADLMAMPQERLVFDFKCVTGWVVRDSVWEGPSLKAVLDRARPLPEARYVIFHSFDGVYSESLSMPQAMEEGVILAHSLGGRELSRDHGAPLRSIVPLMYGYKGTKWLARMTLARDLTPGYWARRGYDVDGYVGRSNGFFG